MDSPGQGTDLSSEIMRDYYDSAPTNYLRTRAALLLALSDPDRPLEPVLTSGVKAFGVSLETAFSSEEDRRKFAAVESLSLLHLSVEALIRLYLAHVDMPACPPLELAGLTSFARFKARARSIADGEGELASLSSMRAVFRGSKDGSCLESVEDDAWAEDGEALRGLVRRAAAVLLEDAAAYNSMKHGIAIQPRNSSLRIGSADTPAGVMIDHSGPALTFLQRQPLVNTGQSPTHIDWIQTTKFLGLRSAMCMIVLCADQIDSLWSVARMRYLSEFGTVQLLTKGHLEMASDPEFGSPHSGLLGLQLSRKFQTRAHAL